MARKIVHQLVDDLDGTVLESGAGQTVLFSLDGIPYEIDLTDENAQVLRDAFAVYLGAARRVVATRSGARSSGSRAGGAKSHRAQTDYGPMREWARQNGFEVSARGRVPASVMAAYEAAH